MKNSTFNNNIIRENNGNGVWCTHKCKITNSLIKNNKGHGIILDSLEENIVDSNFIYLNSDDGINVSKHNNLKIIH